MTQLLARSRTLKDPRGVHSKGLLAVEARPGQTFLRGAGHCAGPTVLRPPAGARVLPAPPSRVVATPWPVNDPFNPQGEVRVHDAGSFVAARLWGLVPGDGVGGGHQNPERGAPGE